MKVYNKTYQATLLGTRETNQDFAISQSLKCNRSRYGVVGVLDGLGSEPDSGAVAELCGHFLYESVAKRLRDRASRKPLDQRDADIIEAEFSAHLGELQNHLKGLQGSTTFALCVADQRQAILMWAGDSRIYALSQRGYLLQLTEDHVTADGQITRCISSASGLTGPASIRLLPVRDLRLLCCMTDGVFGRVAKRDIHLFLIYLMSKGERAAEDVQRDLSGFMGTIARDNATLAYIIRDQSLRVASKQSALVADMHE